MPASEARIAANRANALKSTGPRTQQGKDRSRQNAVKHGLTGEGIALPAEDAEAVALRFDSLRDQFDPKTPLGGVLVKRIAMLSVRLDRSYRRDTAATSERVLTAEAVFDDARKADAEHLLRRIAAEPVTNYRRLMATPEGVNLMIERWEKMKADLDHPDGDRWTLTHYHDADFLHGNPSTNIDQSDYMCWTMALHGHCQHIRPERFAGLDVHGRRQYIMDRLAELVDADLARLREYRAKLDTSAVDAQRVLAPEIALFDPSKEAVLARKYEAATERGLYRAIRELRQVELEADMTPVEQTEPEPIDPPGTLASFFQEPERSQIEAGGMTWDDDLPPIPSSIGGGSVPFTIGRAPSGPA